MIPVLDIHHHGHPLPDAITSVGIDGIPCADDGCLYSIGLHPWDTGNIDFNESRLCEQAASPRVAAIGETGIDRLRGASVDRQAEIFTAHMSVAAYVGKPLIIHCVRAFDILLGLSRKMRCEVPMVIHGFRGKTALARQLLDAGFYLSLGQNFNCESARFIPRDRLLAETDESPLDIREIISRIAVARGESQEHTMLTIAKNITSIVPAAGLRRE